MAGAEVEAREGFWSEVVHCTLVPGYGRRPWARLPADRFRALTAQIDWPDRLPVEDEQLDALRELAEDRIARLRLLPLAERVAWASSYLDAVEALAEQLGDTALPGGAQRRDLAEYAVQRGVDDPVVAGRLAEAPGLLDRTRALVSFADVARRALEGAGVEVEALLDDVAVRDARDLPEIATLGVLIDHPRFGLGLVVGGDFPRTLEVRFMDERRVLEGEACDFRSARGAFVGAALCLCRGAVDALPEDRFFALVEPLGWGARSTDREALVAALATATTLRERLALEGCFWSLRRRLRGRLEAWERASGCAIPASDDTFGDLLSHVIGLGRAEVEATLAHPERALARAERRDFTESFAYVVLGAAERAGREEIEALLREVGAHRPEVAARLVEHPRWGLGVRAEDASVFWERRLERPAPPMS